MARCRNIFVHIVYRDSKLAMVYDCYKRELMQLIVNNFKKRKKKRGGERRGRLMRGWVGKAVTWKGVLGYL